MKKLKILSIVVVATIIIGLLIFASFHEYSDSHLRIEGIRVKLPENSLMVSNCDYINLAKCEKTVTLEGSERKLVFEYKNFKKNGYPLAIAASIDGHEFYRVDGLNLEENVYKDYKIFLNFATIEDKYLMFSVTEGYNGRTTTLYAIDSEGNIILEEHDIDTDNMLIKDTTEFITYKDNVATVYASKVENDINYHGESICNANPKDIVESYYTYSLKNDKFVKKQTKTITAKEFIKEHSIICD